MQVVCGKMFSVDFGAAPILDQAERTRYQNLDPVEFSNHGASYVSVSSSCRATGSWRVVNRTAQITFGRIARSGGGVICDRDTSARIVRPRSLLLLASRPSEPRRQARLSHLPRGGGWATGR